MKATPYQALDQFLYQPRRGHPRTVDRLLIVNYVRRWIEFDCSSFANKCNFAAFARCANCCSPRRGITGTVEGTLGHVAICQASYLGDIIGSRPTDDDAEVEGAVQLYEAEDD